MSLKIHQSLEQGTEEWLQARCGILTASVIGKLLTKTGRIAENGTVRRVALDLLAQRVSGVVEETPQTFAMQRGHEDEAEAKLLYSQHISPVIEVGFMTEDKWGFTLGYSPDGLVGGDGLIECKSRAHGLQMATILSGDVPAEYMAQIQAGLLVSGRKWLDFISFPAMGGGKMMIRRVYPDPDFQERLIEAARLLEEEIAMHRDAYECALQILDRRFLDTEKRSMEEEIIF